MNEKIKEINPHNTVEDILYEILSICKNPIYYKKAKEIIVAVGYYQVRSKKVPNDFNILFSATRYDERFVRLGNGYYALKEWNLEPYVSAASKAEYADTADIISQDPEYEEENNSTIETTRKLPEFNMYFNSNTKLVDEIMNAKETYQDNILPKEIVSFFQYYYDDEELRDVVERAKDEFINQFLPQFVAQEMAKIMEKNKV